MRKCSFKHLLCNESIKLAFISWYRTLVMKAKKQFTLFCIALGFHYLCKQITK